MSILSNTAREIASWFRKEADSVEAILSSWTKTITNLEDLAEKKLAEAAEHNALVLFYEEASDRASEEVEKAKDVIRKLREFFA